MVTIIVVVKDEITLSKYKKAITFNFNILVVLWYIDLYFMILICVLAIFICIGL